MERRAQAISGASRMSVFECIWDRGGAARRRVSHLRAARRHAGPYAVENGLHPLELLPVTEHPLDASWGYQPIGLFAPTRRFGDPQGFARFVDHAHAAGLGVILDWVPAHFPVDAHGLAHFDGTALYEHADPRRGFHPDWNTAIYDFGPPRGRQFPLRQRALLDRPLSIDGLRVDAVASMLYLDYSRKAGEWSPNADGGNDNRDASPSSNTPTNWSARAFQARLMIAEESTAWRAFSSPTSAGGLGFHYKWNMGWMHDTLEYIARDPIHRRWSHDKLTFGLLYAFTENFVLPISHDEVVMAKAPSSARSRANEWQKFATARAYYGFMWAIPQELLFMGQEFGRRTNGISPRRSLVAARPKPHQGCRPSSATSTAHRDLPACTRANCGARGFPGSSSTTTRNGARLSASGGERRQADRRRLHFILCRASTIAWAAGPPPLARGAEFRSTLYGGSNMGNLGGVYASRGGARFPASPADPAAAFDFVLEFDPH